MSLPSVTSDIYLILGAALVGLICYFWWRRKQCRLAALRRERFAKIQASSEVVDDDFYCIMRTNGTCSSGYMKRQSSD